MPYKDPAKQRAAVREAARRRRARSQLQELVDELETLPEPPSRDDLLRILGAQARQGHVTAIRTLLEEPRQLVAAVADLHEAMDRVLDGVEQALNLMREKAAEE